MRDAMISLQGHQGTALEECVAISVVIPVYCSAGTLRILTAQLLAVLEQMESRFEIVFVNDGSSDDSWSVLCELQHEWPDRIVAIDLMRNYGQHNALMCGFRHAQGEFIITMDDDLQNPPEEIPKLVDAITKNDLDLVYGRYAGKKHAAWRNLGSWTVNSFYRFVFGSRCTVSAFRIIRRVLLDSILSYDLNFTFVDGLLAWNTRRIGEVEVEHHARKAGRSGYSIGKLLVLALNLYTNFSLLPLQVASGLGVIVAACGIVCAFYYLVLYLVSSITVPGYASTIIAVLVLGGVQLVALGVIGEYLGRLHLNVNRKPQFVERRVVECDDDASLTHERRIANPSAR
jgi:undecaprenyl-phosphate 4-deoxy-4-formamido-L-arabinose transferase